MNMDKIEITVNDEPLKHKIGDSLFWIDQGSDPFELVIHEEKNCLNSIVITSKGIKFYNEYDELIEVCDRNFWTRKEAEDWLEQNVPKKFALHKNEQIFFKAHHKIVSAVVEGIDISEYKLKYQARMSNGYYYYFLESELNKSVFLSFKEAKEHFLL